MTKPRQGIFPWSKSDFKASRSRKAPRLTCPRGQLITHYAAKGKVCLLTMAANVNIIVHRASYTETGRGPPELRRTRRNCIVDTNVRWAILAEDHGIMF